MNWSAAEVALVPTGVLTVTSTVPAPSAGALQYQVSLAQLREAGERWNQAPVADQLPALKAALQAAWEGLDRAQLFDNPVFDAQAAAYRALGCQVQGVPSYPWGAGGFHCQFLH